MIKCYFKSLKNLICDNFYVAVVVAVCIVVVITTGSIALTVKESADSKFTNELVPDIIINSDDGFSARDVALIKEQTSADIVGVFYADCRYSLGNITAPVRVFSAEGNLNKNNMVEGYVISSDNECVVVKGKNESSLHVGSVINIESDILNKHDFKVVGIMYNDDPDFENAIILSNKVFTQSSYNRLLLNCDFLRRYNTYSDDYMSAVNDVITRLDNIAINRLSQIKSGSYDYRLLGLSKYDPELAIRVEDIYNKKESLEKENTELAAVKEYIDQTELLIKEKSEQLYISSENIQETIGAELVGHEEKLKELTALKDKLNSIDEECKKLDAELKTQADLVAEKKAVLDSIADTSSPDYVTAKNEHEEATKKHTEIKLQLDNKKNEYNKNKTEYDKEYAKYEAAYSASKETYDKLIGDTEISSDEIMQMSIMNYTARAEYNRRLEVYNTELEKMQASQSEVVYSVSELYSSYAKLWYFADRTVNKDYNTYGTFSKVLEISQLVAFIASILIVIIILNSKLEINVCSDDKKYGFSINRFKASVKKTCGLILPSVLFGAIGGYLISILVSVIIVITTKLSLIMPVISVVIVLEIIMIAIMGIVFGSAVLAFKDIISNKE